MNDAPADYVKLAPARHPPAAASQLVHLGPERPHRLGGGQDVGAFQQALDLGDARREGAEDQRPVRDRLVSRRADAPAQG